ncbi:hypothetical protein [Parabacteroides bouchesdurhonensis]|nr:hypothetical protein [Parabacteroides bouchesdurhonensis]
MERINKATLLINLLFLWSKKEEIYQNPQGLVLPFYSWNIPLCSEKERINQDYSIEK